MTTKILFHSPCNDGFSAGLCSWLYFGDKATYQPVSYLSKKLELEPGSDLYLLDFCYPRDTLLDLKSKMNKVVVLDHHKTNFDKVGDLDFCTFDMNRSGAMMAWDFFFKLAESEYELVKSHTPWSAKAKLDNFHKIKPLIEYVQDRDLYQNKLPFTKEVFYALASLPLDFGVWWDNTSIETLIKEGTIIARAVKMLVNGNVKHSFLTDKFAELGYPKIPVVNSSITVYNTDVGQAMLDKYPESPFACTFSRLRDGRYKWSLRSRGGADVALIAEKFGGGGHAGASSFAHESGA